LRGRAGANRGTVNDFYAGKKGGHINLCIISKALYKAIQRGEGRGLAKNALHKGKAWPPSICISLPPPL